MTELKQNKNHKCNNERHNCSMFTNGDYIRSMTDSQLSEFLNSVETDGKYYGPKGRKAWAEWLGEKKDEFY